MPQKHYSQFGIFHIITKTHGDMAWCTKKDIPELIIHNLVRTRDAHRSKLYAFCILPNHLHMLLSPCEKGLAKYMQSFKSNCTKDVLNHLSRNSDAASLLSRNSDAASLLSRNSDAASLLSRNSDAASLLRRTYWQKGYWDERIQSSRQYSTALWYIQGNAIKHRLVKEMIDWPWSSLHFPELLDMPEMFMD